MNLAHLCTRLLHAPSDAATRAAGAFDAVANRTPHSHPQSVVSRVNAYGYEANMMCGPLRCRPIRWRILHRPIVLRPEVPTWLS